MIAEICLVDDRVRAARPRRRAQTVDARPGNAEHAEDHRKNAAEQIYCHHKVLPMRSKQPLPSAKSCSRTSAVMAENYFPSMVTTKFEPVGHADPAGFSEVDG